MTSYVTLQGVSKKMEKMENKKKMKKEKEKKKKKEEKRWTIKYVCALEHFPDLILTELTSAK